MMEIGALGSYAVSANALRGSFLFLQSLLPCSFLIDCKIFVSRNFLSKSRICKDFAWAVICKIFV